MLPKTIKIRGLEFNRRYKSCSYDLKLCMDCEEVFALNVDGRLVAIIEAYYTSVDQQYKVYIDVWDELYNQSNRKYVLNFNRWITELMFFEKGYGTLPLPKQIKDTITNDKHPLHSNSLTRAQFIIKRKERFLLELLHEIKLDYESYITPDYIPCTK